MGLKVVDTRKLLKRLGKKKKPANPNLRPGTKQTQKNRSQKLMEKSKRTPLKRGGKAKKK